MWKKLWFIVVFLMISALWLAACSGKEGEEAASDHAVHWAYAGEEGPEHWSELDAAYAVCGEGQSQSPVDLANVSGQDLENIAFHYQPSQVNILNNGHTIQVNYDAGSYIELDGIRYDLLQFHFHAPGEHTVDGRTYPLELHLVHKNSEGELAVVGVFMESGAENAALAPMWEHLPAEESEATAVDAQINAQELLPAEAVTYRYSGSLTTPPCTEGVRWNVMLDAVPLSAEQIAAFEAIFEGNNRPVQSLNGRTLTEDTTP